jgi:hypothetical protein
MAVASSSLASSRIILRTLHALAPIARQRNGANDFVVHSGGMPWAVSLLEHEALQGAENTGHRDAVALSVAQLLSDVRRPHLIQSVMCHDCLIMDCAALPGVGPSNAVCLSPGFPAQHCSGWYSP